MTANDSRTAFCSAALLPTSAATAMFSNLPTEGLKFIGNGPNPKPNRL